MKISKEFKWEMAHKLSRSYTEKCMHIHGHSYKAVVVIEGAVTSDKNGVVMDFTEVKEALNFLFDVLDHSFMFYEGDPSADLFMELANRDKRRIIVSNFEPTAENIAAFIFKIADRKLRRDLCWIDSVEVYETATSKAVATGSDESAALGCYNCERITSADFKEDYVTIGK